MAPISGAGHLGSNMQENVIAFGFISLSIAIVPLCAIVLWGLRGGIRNDPN